MIRKRANTFRSLVPFTLRMMEEDQLLAMCDLLHRCVPLVEEVVENRADLPRSLRDHGMASTNKAPVDWWTVSSLGVEHHPL